jgi:hypothetical protein
MKRVLIIDDDAIRVSALSRYAGWIVPGAEIVHSETFVADWDGYDMVMLDHDLGRGGDVYDHVRKAFPEGYDGLALVCIHSMNPVGARNIQAQVGGDIRPYSSILSFVSSK